MLCTFCKKNLLFFLLTLFLVPTLFGCTQGQMRGLAQHSYVSSTRPSLQVTVPNLPVLGHGKVLHKLQGMGVLGGLSVETWFTLFGNDEKMVVVAHADLPFNWKWDANMSHSFVVQTTNENLAGQSFFAQTFLTIQGKNPFVSADESEKDLALRKDDRWLVRAFSARFNDEHSKLIIEYREKLPQGVTDLTALPMGQERLLKDFAARALDAFRLEPVKDAPLATSHPLPKMRLRYADEHFFGSAQPRESLRVY